MTAFLVDALLLAFVIAAWLTLVVGTVSLAVAYLRGEPGHGLDLTAVRAVWADFGAAVHRAAHRNPQVDPPTWRCLKCGWSKPLTSGEAPPDGCPQCAAQPRPATTTAWMPDKDPLTCDECNGTIFRRYAEQPELLICATCSHGCNHEGGVNAPYHVPPTAPLTDPMDRVREQAAKITEKLQS